MKIEEKIAVMQAFADGRTVEQFNRHTGKWYVVQDPTWDWALYEYRIAPNPRPILPWKVVSDQYNYLYKGVNGWVLAAEKPEKDLAGRWHHNGVWCFITLGAESGCYPCPFANAFLPDDCPWEDSLIARPGHE